MISFDRNNFSRCHDAYVVPLSSSCTKELATDPQRNVRHILIFIILLTIVSSSYAQQLVLLKKNKVRGRFNSGDEIRYSKFTKGHLRSDVIRSITDTSFVTSTDTILLYEVRRVDGRITYDFTRSLGIKMMTAGFLLQFGDYVNVTLVQDQHYNFSPAITIISAGMMVTGFVLHRVRRPYITLSRSAALVSARKGSPLHR
jgi:hypothetical protein